MHAHVDKFRKLKMGCDRIEKRFGRFLRSEGNWHEIWETVQKESFDFIIPPFVTYTHFHYFYRISKAKDS